SRLAFATCRSRSSTETAVVLTPLEVLEFEDCAELFHGLGSPFIIIGEPGELLSEEPNKGEADENDVCKLKMDDA
ncbi:4593_t:CDS:1, partial [Racocetra fulgida]